MLHTVIDCGALTNPVDGIVNTAGGTTFGMEATYSCMDGYELTGPPTRVCTRTGWNGTEPICSGESH